MQALVFERFGEDPRIGEVRVPTAGPGEVVVRQQHAGIGAGDALMVAGRPWLFRPVFRMTIGGRGVFGREVAGVVEAVGEGVQELGVGDRVIGEAAGAWAERVAIAASACARVPDGVALREAAALPVSAITALQGLRAGGVREGARVLVVGASGGVGHFAVQLAVAQGARVTGVCSGAKAAWVEDLGAERVLDYRRQRFTEEAATWDVILDLVGDRPLGACVARLAPGGVYVSSAGSNGGWLLGPLPRLMLAGLRGLVDRRVKVLTTTVNRQDLTALLALMEQGALVPRIDAELPVDQVSRALELWRTGRIAGKVVLSFG